MIAAGSVVGFDQIELLARAGAWGFTIGGAIFEGKLPGCARRRGAGHAPCSRRSAAAGPAAVVAMRQPKHRSPSGIRGELLDATCSTARYASGVKLPNEDELAERFGVSRATVREAVGGLVEAGYVTRRHGSGTYVDRDVAAPPRARHVGQLHER